MAEPETLNETLKRKAAARLFQKRLVGPRGGTQWKGIINDALGPTVLRAF